MDIRHIFEGKFVEKYNALQTNENLNKETFIDYLNRTKRIKIEVQWKTKADSYLRQISGEPITYDNIEIFDNLKILKEQEDPIYFENVSNNSKDSIMIYYMQNTKKLQIAFGDGSNKVIELNKPLFAQVYCYFCNTAGGKNKKKTKKQKNKNTRRKRKNSRRR